MKKYIFDFGRNHELSLAELISYLKMKDYNFRFEEITNRGALVSIENFNPLKATTRLGGIKRIGKVLGTDCRQLRNIKLYKRQREKLFYNVKEIENNGVKMKIKEMLKQKFKEQNLKAMYKEMDLGNMVKKNSLEILIFDEYIARTISISNPLDFRERDVKRPNKDRKITTSIRLTDILLNLAQVRTDEVILDPFCGNGTILQEGLFFGLDVKGLDINKSRVGECKENVNWFKKRYCIGKDSNIKEGNVRKLSRYFRKDSIDVIVSEPELGPLLKELPTDHKAEEIIQDLEELYNGFFDEVGKILDKGGRIVIILPRIKSKNGKYYDINTKGIMSGTKLEFSNIFENFSINMPLEYSERWHKLERLIYILKTK